MGDRLDRLLERSIASLRRFHSDLAVHVAELPQNSDIMAKSLVFDSSPFDETLYLDCDTVVLSPIGFGFEAAQKHALACCISECPWARRYAALKDAGDVIEYNTGVLFFTRAARTVFDLWKESARKIDSSARFYIGDRIDVGYNDQGPFAYAIRQLQFIPFVLPQNFNLRPMWQRGFWGPVKIWHSYDDVPASVVQFCDEQSRPDAVIRFATLG